MHAATSGWDQRLEREGAHPATLTRAIQFFSDPSIDIAIQLAKEPDSMIARLKSPHDFSDTRWFAMLPAPAL